MGNYFLYSRRYARNKSFVKSKIEYGKFSATEKVADFFLCKFSQKEKNILHELSEFSDNFARAL